MIADLACLATGFVTVPLDPEVAWDRDELAQRFDLNIVLTDCPIPDRAGGGFLGFDAVCGAPEAADLEPVRWGADESFTVTFTSGTTGEPKVIEVQKRCFDDQFSNALRMFSVTPGDKMLVFLPMHIYLERCYVYLAILRGFDVVVALTRFVAKALKGAGFTFTVGVPQFFTSLQDMFLMQIQACRAMRLRCWVRMLLFRCSLRFILRRPFRPFQQMLGGKARFFLTGSAPCPLGTLEFYHAMGLPLYEGYGLSEVAGMIAINYPGNTKLGTVGKVFPNKEVKLDSEGQIWVRGKYAASGGYWRAPAEVNAATFSPGGWVATGDIGRFDGDGYLVIVGRSKDVIVLSNGRKVQPRPIETEIDRIDFVDYSIVIGDERPYLVALISVKSPTVNRARLDECIRVLNQARPDADRVRKYRILTDRFTTENGLLTRALKLNRKRIKQHYGHVIDEMYSQ